MKDEDVKALAVAANDLLCLIDCEEIVIDMPNTTLNLGELRNVLLQVEMALWPFDELLEDEDKADETHAFDASASPLNKVN